LNPDLTSHESRILKPWLMAIVVYLLASALYLLLPGEGAWAVPGQNPHRQSSPTRTPTPGGTATPANTPRAPGGEGESSVPPAGGMLSLPSTTVTPLFLTLFPPTATPISTWVGATWEVETAEGRNVPTRQPSPAPTEKGVAILPGTRTVERTAVPASPDSRAFSMSTLRASTMLDCAVTASGLVLLSVGLILVGRHRR
jgi:hypothetical protein